MSEISKAQAAYECAYDAQVDGLIGLPSVPWDSLDDPAQSSWDDIASAAIDAASLRQPAELAAAMAETRAYRELLRRVRSVLLEDGPRMREVAIGLIDHNPIGG